MTFKKILTVMTVALSALVLAGAAFAADTVGTIDTQKVMFQHPKFQQVQRQVRDVTEKLQKDAQAAIDKESDNKKKAEIYQTEAPGARPGRKKAHGAALQGNQPRHEDRRQPEEAHRSHG